jgi:hypothetical protein
VRSGEAGGVSRLLPFVFIACSGCTLAGGVIGGISASSANKEARAKQQPETASVGARVLGGAIIGLVIDALIIRESMEGCCPDFGNTR